MIDARTPVLVGVGQVRQRANDPTVAKEPLTLMAEAAELAAEDAGAPDLLAHLDAIRIPHGLWKYGNPGAWLAERFGAASPHTELGQINGTMVLRMLSRSAADIQAGTSDAVLIVGGEAEHSKRRARKAGKRAPRTQLDGPPPDEPMEPYADFGSSAHVQAGLVDPTHCFGLFETALRHRSGLDVDAHRTAVAELWAGFASVAATNPNAWIQDPKSPDEIRRASCRERV